MSLKSISDPSFGPTSPRLRGARKAMRVLLRLSLNVPVSGDVINDDFRLIKSLPTLQTLIDMGAKVTVISHIGGDGTQSLGPVEKWLRERLPAQAGVRGEFVMHENLRLDPREKSGDESLARELADIDGGQDIFVNEDFAVSHRAHASVTGLPKLLPSFVGLQFAQEVEHLTRFIDPPEPCVVILGGAKIETKLPMINAFLPKASKIFLGSYFANSRFDLSNRGSSISQAKSVEAIPTSPKVILPIDGVSKDGHIMDIGEKALGNILEAVESAKSVIWNGPMGKFEDGYDQTTLELARAIANSGAESVVGGGDSISAIRKLNLLDKFTFVSTGGGAMLEYLSKGTLPGIDAIINSPHFIP